MKILHITHSVNPAGGGVIEAVRQIATAHRDEGHRVEILSLDKADDSWAKESKIPVHPMGSWNTSYGYSRRMVPWLQRNHQDYDAVVVNGIWQYSSFGAWRGLAGTSTPYYVLPHGMLDPWFKHTYPLKHFKKVLYWRFAERHVLRDARSVLFMSEEERRLARESFRPYDCREAVINLGIAEPPAGHERQEKAFHRQFPDLRGQRILLFLGRIHFKKGIELLLKAFAEISRDSQRSDKGSQGLHLVIAGPCSDFAHLAHLKGMASLLGLSQNNHQTDTSGNSPSAVMTWLPMLTGDLKWGALRTADAFILPSHQENFGLAVVEALACGTPVLISDKVNVWREIQADGAAFVEQDDVAGTRRLVERWIGLSAEEREAMRYAARECYTARFEIGRSAERLIEVIESDGALAEPTSC